MSLLGKSAEVRVIKWVRRRLGRDRRWISDQAERDAHDDKIHERLPRRSAPDNRDAEGGLPDDAPRSSG